MECLRQYESPKVFHLILNARGIGEEDRIVWGEVKFDYPEKTVEGEGGLLTCFR